MLIKKTPKIKFDVNSRKHVEHFRNFVINKAWGIAGCPYVCEFPFLNVPDMIQKKLLCKMLKVNYENRY